MKSAAHSAHCAYTQHGRADGSVVVLLHSIATNSKLWLPQIAVWADSFRVVCIDLPGHGKSAPDDSADFADYAERVIEVLDELKIDRAALVGLSLGGMVAQAIALNHPERVASLVLAHTGAQTLPAVKEIWHRRLEQLEVGGIESQIAPTIERWFTRDFVSASPLTMACIADMIASTSTQGYAAAVGAIQKLDHLDKLHRIEAPTLVVAGAEDSAVPPVAAEAIAKQIRGAKFAVLANAAHIGNVEQPVAFTEVVGEFLLSVAVEHATQH